MFLLPTVRPCLGFTVSKKLLTIGYTTETTITAASSTKKEDVVLYGNSNDIVIPELAKQKFPLQRIAAVFILTVDQAKLPLRGLLQSLR
jgi:hypothetical protein